jgi:hypothetical protein
MVDLRVAINRVWEEAGCGDTPVVLATLITNAAFAAFEGVEQRLGILCNGSNPETLRCRVMQIPEDLEVA